MGYTTIINLIFGSLISLFGLLVFHFIFFAIVGIFAKKRFPKTDKKLKYAILIPTRNEAKVVGNLLDSIHKNDYPDELLDIFVVAHNCTDDTAEVARAHGATVYEYDNPDEKTKGFALKYLISCIQRDRGSDVYDGFMVFDADNILNEDYIERMNEAFVAHDGKNTITSYRNSKNFAHSILTAIYGLYFLYTCRFEARGRTVLGCSTRVSGTGYLFPAETIKDGWKYLTLCEDWEFTADQLLLDRKIIYCDDAVFYDEQPTSVKVMLKQRLRWAKGHLLVCVTRCADIFKALFRSKKHGGSAHKISVYDFSVNIAPIGIISFCLSFFQMLLLCFSPLFGDYTAWAELGGYLKTALTGLACTYGVAIIGSFVLYALERKRIPKVRLWKKVISSILWPGFVLIAIPLEIISLFVRNLGWTPIPHSDTTKIEELSAAAEKD